MALKFLNKKGWHTGSLRNIENVWKAEQKHDAEQKKLEELRKQIHEEREKSEFRQIQEAAGLVPRQERLDFMYESGLAVGKGSSDGFKALQEQPPGGASSSAAEPSSSKAVVPGALFEDKPQSANDAWRKLHSDPLLLIRQREQEALAKIKNNPIRMAMIRKSVESERKQQDKKEHKKKKKKHKHDHSKSKDEGPSKSQSDSKYCSEYDDCRKRDRPSYSQQQSNRDDKQDRRDDKKRDRKVNHASEKEERSVCFNSDSHEDLVRGDYSSRGRYGERKERNGDRPTSDNHDFWTSSDNYSSKSYLRSRSKSGGGEGEMSGAPTISHHACTRDQPQSVGNRRRALPKMTDEEREARLREMQADAEHHEGQRWRRLKKASEADALEASQASYSRGRSFLDATQKSVYGVERGGSATIEESLRRRTYYSQGSSAHETNAFRR